MVLIELIVQGLKPDQSTTKITFKRSLNVVQTGTIEINELMREIVLSLFYKPDHKLKQLVGSLPHNQEGKLRGGLTLRSQNDTIRLVKDFNSGSGSLSQFKEETQQFSELSRDDKFFRELLKTRFNLPPKEIYENLFFVGGKSLDAVMQSNSKESSQISKGAEYFDTLDESAGPSDEEKRERLNQLKQQLKTLEQIQTFEFKLDELQQKAFEKEEIIERVKQKEEMVKNTENEIQQVQQVNPDINIPPNIKERIDHYLECQKRRRVELHRLEQRADKLTRELVAKPVDPVFKSPLFIGGIVVFAASAGLFFFEMRVPFVVGLFVAIGCVATAFVQQISGQDRSNKLKQQLDQLDEDKLGVEKKYEIEMAAVDHLMKRLQIKNPNDIMELVAENQTATDKLQQERAELDKLRRELNVDQAEKDLNSIKQEANSVRKRMRGVEGGNFDPMSIRREIGDLEQELGITATDANFAIGGVDTFDDPIDKLLSVASKLFNIPKAALIDNIKPGLERNLQTISERQFAEPVIENEKIVALSTGKGGKPKALSDFSGAELAYAYIACQFTLIQVLSKNGYPLPVILLNLPAPLEKTQRIIYKAFKFLSQSTQVVHFDGKDGAEALGETPIKI